jgi:hypothetical protein
MLTLIQKSELQLWLRGNNSNIRAISPHPTKSQNVHCPLQKEVLLERLFLRYGGNCVGVSPFWSSSNPSVGRIVDLGLIRSARWLTPQRSWSPQCAPGSGLSVPPGG